jgi:hypothetical protein
MKLCATPACINEFSDKSKLDTCPTCRGGLGYWKKKRPAQRLERRRKLTMYNARISTMAGAEDAELKAYIKEKRGG